MSISACALTPSILGLKFRLHFVFCCPHYKFLNLRLHKEQFTRAGLEHRTSRLPCRRSTNWAIYPYIGSLPILSVSLFRGASQKPMNIYLSVSLVVYYKYLVKNFLEHCSSGKSISHDSWYWHIKFIKKNNNLRFKNVSLCIRSCHLIQLATTL